MNGGEKKLLEIARKTIYAVSRFGNSDYPGSKHENEAHLRHSFNEKRLRMGRRMIRSLFYAWLIVYVGGKIIYKKFNMQQK